MYKLHGIMRQGTIDSALTSVRYATLEEARAGARELLCDDTAGDDRVERSPSPLCRVGRAVI
jgi:hypothetical protein